MRIQVLSVCALLALASAIVIEEDETEVLSNPFHQHAVDFMDKFESFLKSRPTGRPGSLLKTIHGHYRDAQKQLSAHRPTGRPFRSHKQRAEFNHANWLLNKNFRTAQNKLRQYNNQVRLAAKKAMLQASAAKQADADETEVLKSSQFHGHSENFKGHFDDLFAGRPTGRPQEDDIKKAVKQYLNMIGEKFRESKTNMGKAIKGHKNTFKDAYKQLVDYRTAAEKQVKAWRKQQLAELQRQKNKERDAADADETEVVVNGYLSHAKDFIKKFQKKFGTRPTGRPNSNYYFNYIREIYAEAKQNMLNTRPTGTPTPEQKMQLKLAQKRLAKLQNQAQQQVKDWVAGRA